VLGAVYIDSGFGVAHAAASRLLQDAFDELALPSEDYKSTLQELLQEQERRIPRYRISSQEGPDHAKVFVATVEAGGRVLGDGRGQSKKQAEQAAAREALQHLARRHRGSVPQASHSGGGGPEPKSVSSHRGGSPDPARGAGRGGPRRRDLGPTGR
jgi:hypothetical protein